MVYSQKNTHAKQKHPIKTEMCWGWGGDRKYPYAQAVTYHTQSHYCRFRIGHSLGRMGGPRRRTVRRCEAKPPQINGNVGEKLKISWATVAVQCGDIKLHI